MERPKIKKRKYSRKGCKECKRRKIKCDESVPECFNCSRLKKLCVYPDIRLPDLDDLERELPLTVKFYNPAAALPAKLPSYQKGYFDRQDYLDNGPHSMPGPPNSLPGPAGPSSPPGPHNGQPHPPNGLPHHSPGLHNGPPEGMPQTGDNGYALDGYRDNFDLKPKLPTLGASSKAEPLHMPPGGDFPDMLPDKDFLQLDMKALYSEALVLVHEINHCYGFDGRVLPNYSAGSEESLGFGVDDFVPFAANLALPLTHSRSELSNTELIDQCVREHQLEEPHVNYLCTLTTTDLAYHLFPFAALVQLNAVVHLLLKHLVKCTYLITLLLAILATFQFNQTGDKLHEQARHRYTVVCFKALSDAFAENMGFQNTAIFTLNIEKLLLTVLVLSLYFTATAPTSSNIADSWKAHLNGARDLLVNFSRLAQPTYMSGGLALAWLWFFAIEASAVIHTNVGGALLGLDPMDPPLPTSPSWLVPPLRPLQLTMYFETGCTDAHVNPEYHNALARNQLICPTITGADFHLFWGFTLLTLKPILAYLACMDAIRSGTYARAPFRWTMNLLGLLDGCFQDIVVPGVSLRTYEIPDDSVAHPEHGLDRLALPGSYYVADYDEQGVKRYYSWFDLSHQIHVDYIILRILVSQRFLGLRRSHPDVQYFVDKILNSFFIFKKKPVSEPNRGLVIVETDDYYLSRASFDNRCIMVQLIFRLLIGIVLLDAEFQKLELFFMGLVKLGNGSSLSALDNLAKIRKSRAEYKAQLNGAVDDQIFDYFETTNDIPFA